MDPAPLLWALGVAAVFCAAGLRPWKAGEAPPRGGTFLLAAAIPACFAVAWRSYTSEWPAPLPEELISGKHWILPGVLLATLAGLAPQRSRVVVRLLLAFLCARVVVGSGHALALQAVEGGTFFPELAMECALVLYAFSAAHLADREGPEGPLLLTAALVGGALATANGGWALGAVALGAIGQAVGGGLVIGAWRRSWATLAGAGLAVGVAGAGVLLVGYRLSETPLSATLCAAAIPLLGWVPGKRWPLAILRVAIAAGLAYFAWKLSVPPPDPYSGYS